MKVIIYGIINPIDNQVVYVGQTSDDLNHYIKSKYWKLNEVKRGQRNWTKFFHFIDDLLPIKVTAKVLYECDTTKPFQNPNGMEKIFIEKYKKINPNLLNETDGGKGGFTHKYKTDEEKAEIGRKISIKNKGKKKPEGFGERLSALRKGNGNPMCKPFKTPIGCFKNDKLIKVFYYTFEIDNFLNKKGAWSNVKKVLDCKYIGIPYGYNWRYMNS